MPYVKRDNEGGITAVSEQSDPGFEEFVSPGTAELDSFLSSLSQSADLARTDLEFVRVLEDLLDVLISKNLLLFTELPPEAQQKVLARQALRRFGNSLNILEDN